MIRLCMRPGCDRDAAARLTYDPVACEVWLDDLAERVGRNQEICSLHAERLTVPRGWVLSDRRSQQPAMFVTPAAPTAASPAAAAADSAAVEPAPGPRRRRRRAPAAHPATQTPATQTMELFEVLRQELAQAEADAEQPAPEPEPEPEAVAEPAPEPEPVPAHEPVTASEREPDEVPEALRATSPLLARAFASTGHQRSVLTQRAADDGDERS